MTLGVAVSVVITAVVASVSAGVTVVLSWLRLVDAPQTLHPALWAARSYVAYFDLFALLLFPLVLVLCRQRRLGFE